MVENSDPQCVKCNEIFTTSTELYEHKLRSHDKLDCQICKEKEKVIEELQEHNESLVKKNVALHKELRRTKLAFKESTHEKAEINKELTLQRESLAEALKENTILNEEVKVKTSYIKLLKEKGRDTENVASVVTDQEISENLSESNMGQKQKCKECDFETSVPKYLKSHAIVAHTGQYSCQRGCKIKFKMLSDLDAHIKVYHKKQPDHTVFKCDKCDATFSAQFQMRQHITKKHSRPVQLKFDCKFCGQLFPNL